MRRHAQGKRRDWNEAQIVSALRSIGVSVLHLSGSGVPDLLTFHARDGMRLLEVKQPRGRLTPEQIKLHQTFPVSVVHSVDEALALFGVRHALAQSIAPLYPNPKG